MDRELFEDAFDYIYERDALIIKPAEGSELKRCQEDLSTLGAPWIPVDYIEFLEMANGISWNGFEFYGTYQITVKKTGYVLEDIVSVNSKWRKRKIGLEKKLVLGTFDDDLFIYDPEYDIYLIVDNMTLAEIDSYSRFQEMFLYSLSDYIDEQ